MPVTRTARATGTHGSTLGTFVPERSSGGTSFSEIEKTPAYDVDRALTPTPSTSAPRKTRFSLPWTPLPVRGCNWCSCCPACLWIARDPPASPPRLARTGASGGTTGCCDDGLKCACLPTSWVSGKLKWTCTDAAQELSSSPSVSKDLVYVGSNDIYLHTVNKITGEFKFEFLTW